MTPRERADRAKLILDDPVFAHAFADIREQLVAKLEMCPVGDVEAQHDLTLTLQLLKQLRTQLARYCEEIVLDNAKARQESWLRRAKQSLTT
ncbi:MAG: hypothetical protein IPG77_25050 [Betaproteobacteria bacterium]|nr:hypothetical protein [Betaproteobacteria bacterium]